MNQNDYQQVPGSATSPDQKENEKNGENKFPEERGIGELFRIEREKIGASYSRIFETTRLRPYYLEALENEDWEKLPSPVFVTGFIRAYARALGLEEGRIVALYQKAVPSETLPPMPLMAPAKSRKVFFLVLIFLLLASASAYFLWKEHSRPERLPAKPETLSTEDGNIRGQKNIQGNSYQVSPKRPDEGKEPAADVTDDPSRITLIPESSGEPFDLGALEYLSEEEEEGLPAAEFLIYTEPTPSPGVDTPPFVLRATVRERTYVRIFVDDREPKEYVFRAGSQPEWEAQKGFELIIGNAGGIDFELNGEKVGNLGRSGQVIGLRLPKGYERRNPQN